jgi:hypothetical protein
MKMKIQILFDGGLHESWKIRLLNTHYVFAKVIIMLFVPFRIGMVEIFDQVI